jgi:hypothetical protein
MRKLKRKRKRKRSRKRRNEKKRRKLRKPGLRNQRRTGWKQFIKMKVY